MNKHSPALLAAFMANLIYGLNFVVAKTIMPDFLQPRAIILLRVVAAALFFWLLVMFSGKQEKVARFDLYRIAFASLFGVAINQILFFEGLNLTSPIHASIIMVNVPILVMIMSLLIIRERITRLKIIGVLAGAGGASFIILSGSSPVAGSSSLLGDFFILLNASSYGLYLVLIKPVMLKYKPITVVRWVFFFGSIFVLPFSAHIAWQADWAAIPASVWLAILYVIFCTTILAYFLNNYSLVRISPTANSTFIYLQPVFASVIAVLYMGDQLKIVHLMAALLIFAGVYMVSRQPKTY